MKLRLFHHSDGARVAYRDVGSGPTIVLLHSALLSHREFEPLVAELSDRFRLVLCDLPLHGDSEDRPRHPYTPQWFADVIAAFCRDVAGPRPLVAGHGLGAEVLLRATLDAGLEPQRLVLMPNRLHRDGGQGLFGGPWRAGARAAALPGLDRALAHAARLVFRPRSGLKLSARGNREARDLVRHAFDDVGGNANLARSWSRFAASWPSRPWRELLDAYERIDCPVLLLWADQDRMHPLQGPQEARDLLPDAHLRVLDDTGYLIAYDDPVGVARELAAFLV